MTEPQPRDLSMHFSGVFRPGIIDCGLEKVGRHQSYSPIQKVKAILLHLSDPGDIAYLKLWNSLQKKVAWAQASIIRPW